MGEITRGVTDECNHTRVASTVVPAVPGTFARKPSSRDQMDSFSRRSSSGSGRTVKTVGHAPLEEAPDRNDTV